MIAIIDYGVGNLFSVEKAFAKLGAEVLVTDDAAVIERADKIVLPGVGAFGDCMENLTRSGLIPAIRQAIARKPERHDFLARPEKIVRFMSMTGG